MSLLTMGLSFFLLPESLTPERRRPARAPGQPSAGQQRGAMLRLPGVALIMLIAFGGQFAFFSFQSVYVLWAERLLFVGRDPQFVQGAIGLILTFVGVSAIAAQVWLVGPLVRRFGERLMVAGGTLIASLGLHSGRRKAEGGRRKAEGRRRKAPSTTICLLEIDDRQQAFSVAIVIRPGSPKIGQFRTD